MNSASPASHFHFSSKADTLERLAPLLTTGRVLPLIKFTVGQWQADPQAILDLCANRFEKRALIVRSSSLSEDQEGSSTAGVHDSVSNVLGATALSMAVENVIASYGQKNPCDEVLVQPMATDVQSCGVAMTQDPASGLSYYLIDYVPGDDTDGVTAGTDTVHSFVTVKSHPRSEPLALRGLFSLLAEVEQLTGREGLDIEFAITTDGPILFQVRPMTAVPVPDPLSDLELHTTLDLELTNLQVLISNIIGQGQLSGAILGSMPDWNPAEMIGVKPRPLAYSLYRELITEVNWASARFRYGYRDMRKKPLMYEICGSPFICIPYSLESFIPAALPQRVINAVICTCSEHLAAHQSLHDKIEFSVIPTCFTPDLVGTPPVSIPAFKDLNPADCQLYLHELKSMTERIMSPDGPFFSDLTRLPRIEHEVERLGSHGPHTDPLQRLRHSFTHAKIVGEVFSGVARAAFVATAVIKSLEAMKCVSEGFTDTLIGGVHTVGRVIANDFKILHRDTFLRSHGHVRPGTYDIRVARYDESPDIYFDWRTPPRRPDCDEPTRPIDRSVLTAVQQAFNECQLHISAEHFFRFLSAAVSAREKVKYQYGALVSDALKALSAWGNDVQINREALSFIEIEDFIGDANEVSPERIREKIAHNRLRWHATQNIRTPLVVCAPSDLLSHTIETSNPNFITRRAAEAPVVVLQTGASINPQIEGCIVLIENADPGFDWIFTHRVAGFITAYGGENSHMSIRAREFSVPAAIGVGDAKYRRLSSASRLQLDCAAQRIQVLS